MYKIKTSLSFSGAHFLRNYKGKCESLHGHNWKIEVIGASSELDRAGMVMDFGELKKIINVVLDELDHKHLNDLDYFKDVNPSSEEIARYIYDRIKPQVEKFKVVLCEVRVWETDNSCAMYYE